jgi:hypothetical protein
MSTGIHGLYALELNQFRAWPCMQEEAAPAYRKPP